MEALVEQYQKFLARSSSTQENTILLDQFEEVVAEVLSALDRRGTDKLLNKEVDETAQPIDLSRVKTALQALHVEGLSLDFVSDEDMVRFIIKLAYMRALKRAR
jgi:hypothetical protein